LAQLSTRDHIKTTFNDKSW